MPTPFEDMMALLDDEPEPEPPPDSQQTSTCRPQQTAAPNISLEAARQQFWRDIERGTDCLLCGRHAKLYKRKLNSGMARMLIVLFNMSLDLPPEANGWVHVSRILLQSGVNAVAQEYSKLRFWGLLEERPNDNPETPGSGFWRVTLLATNFVRGLTSVPRRVFVYDNQCLGHSDERTTIQEALGDRFNYEELMAG